MDPIEAPLISVIMPAYNTEQYIGEAIQSILDQTYPHFELLICDDGSTDQTYTIAEHYASIDARIKLFRNSRNIGNLKTTNFLFDQCDGEYIAIQDSDDICKNERLEILKNSLMNSSEIMLVGSNYFICDEKLKILSCSIMPKSHEAISEISKKEVPPILYGSIMFRSNLLKLCGKFRPVFKRNGLADLDWLYRICEQFKCENINEHLYLYRQIEGNKYPSKGLFPNYGLIILHEAHLQRLQGNIDFIESYNMKEIKKFTSNYVCRQGEKYIWSGSRKAAISKFIESVLIYPLNSLAIKNLLKYVFFKTKTA
jgi:glycosyltransferase involved in cell wall biosynthesis